MTAAQLRDTLVQIALASTERERLRLIGVALMQHAATETIPGLLVTEFPPPSNDDDVHRVDETRATTPPAPAMLDDDPLIAYNAQHPLAVLSMRGI